MGQGWRWRVVAGVLGAALWAAGCGGGAEGRPGEPGPSATGEQTPQGTDTPDAGQPPPPPTDGGLPPPPTDAGFPPPPSDGGTPPPDGGEPDGGEGELTVVLPSAAGWTFYGPQHGGPQQVMGVTQDEGGNIWVAGGEEGLFLLRPGAARFERFTMEDGLRPYGYMPDGSEPPGSYKKLDVISVAGGKAGTVFVGYRGHPLCEDNGHGSNPDPSIYKSGDADKVTLTSSGLHVVHYDIFSGPGVVKGYEYREKVCTIYRIVYDERSESVWFGGNHGFVWGDATYQGDPTCNGQLHCSGLTEHAHPHLNATAEDGSIVLLTDAYYGIAPAPNGDVWFGGANRSTRFRDRTPASWRYDFWDSQEQTEWGPIHNRIDIWPDHVDETKYPTPAQRVDDLVSAMVAMPDDTVWVASFAHGLAHLDSGGGVMGRAFTAQADRNLSALARDTANGSLWVGHRYGGGVSRLGSGTVERYWQALGNLGNHPVFDIQSFGMGANRKVLVAFGRSDDGSEAGAIGVYTGR